MSRRRSTSESLPPYEPSETTPLMRRRYKRQCTRVVLVLLLIVPLTIWGPYILSGVPIERYKWNKELMRQREAEKSRIDQWEQELKTEQQEWEQELIRQREAENSRIDQWEQELNMRKTPGKGTTGRVGADAKGDPQRGGATTRTRTSSGGRVAARRGGTTKYGAALGSSDSRFALHSA